MNMKKMLTGLMIVPMLLLGACSGKAEEPAKEPMPSEITSAIMAEITIPSAVEKGKEDVGAYYDIDVEQAESISVFICGSGAYPDELAVFKMSSPEQAQVVKDIAQKRLDNQMELYKDYTPNEVYKLEEAQVTVKGNYVMLFVCENDARALEIAESLF